MKLTEENQDYMDCRPGGRETGVQAPPHLEALIAARKAGKAALQDEAPPEPKRSAVEEPPSILPDVAS